jgi:hypothetical protein
LTGLEGLPGESGAMNRGPEMRMRMNGLGKTLAVFVVITLALATGCIYVGDGGPIVQGSPTLTTVEYDHTGFTAVEVDHAFTVDITRSDSFGVSVTTNENLVDYVDVTLVGDTLRIRMEPGHSFSRSTRRATVSMPELTSLRLSSASRGEVTGLHTEGTLELDLSSASTVELRDITAGRGILEVSGASSISGEAEFTEVAMDVSGASTVRLSGSAREADIRVSGASSGRLADFPIENASVDASGASNVTIDVSGTLDLEVSGASRLTYRGSPSLGRVDVSGASSLSQD